jgi:hypothetical protein
MQGRRVRGQAVESTEAGSAQACCMRVRLASCWLLMKTMICCCSYLHAVQAAAGAACQMLAHVQLGLYSAVCGLLQKAHVQ